jgi:hypothetical protein
MSPESLQTIIVAVVAILLLFQLAVLVGIALLVVRIRKPLEELIANAREVVGIARHRAERLDVTLAQISRMVQNRAEQADGIARELLDASRVQVLAADRLLGNLVRKIEYATEESRFVSAAQGPKPFLPHILDSLSDS